MSQIRGLVIRYTYAQQSFRPFSPPSDCNCPVVVKPLNIFNRWLLSILVLVKSEYEIISLTNDINLVCLTYRINVFETFKIFALDFYFKRGRPFHYCAAYLCQIFINKFIVNNLKTHN